VNAAMVPHAYGIRTLRLMGLMHFVQLLEVEDLKEFWSLFGAQDSERFGAGRSNRMAYSYEKWLRLRNRPRWLHRHAV
jgi:hypothetical protein